MIYVTPVDGSVVLATAVGKAPRDKEGRATGPIPKKRKTLLAADKRLMGIVQEMRYEIIQQREEEKKALREGRRLHTSKVATFMGLLPFGKRGFFHRRALERAEAHMWEATLEITDKGDVEVSVDGTIVLRKRAPSFLGFRRTDRSYELRVQDKGIEVSRKGKVVWGVKAEDIF
ncbi:unnamed protein product [Ectocarpus sp. 8 AP-2014]